MNYSDQLFNWSFVWPCWNIPIRLPVQESVWLYGGQQFGMSHVLHVLRVHWLSIGELSSASWRGVRGTTLGVHRRLVYLNRRFSISRLLMTVSQWILLAINRLRTLVFMGTSNSSWPQASTELRVLTTSSACCSTEFHWLLNLAIKQFCPPTNYNLRRFNTKMSVYNESS